MILINCRPARLREEVATIMSWLKAATAGGLPETLVRVAEWSVNRILLLAAGTPRLSTAEELADRRTHLTKGTPPMSLRLNKKTRLLLVIRQRRSVWPAADRSSKPARRTPRIHRPLRKNLRRKRPGQQKPNSERKSRIKNQSERKSVQRCTKSSHIGQSPRLETVAEEQKDELYQMFWRGSAG